MDMSFVLLIVVGVLTSVVMAGLFQTVIAVVRRRVSGKPARK